jgi:hypothetical protein
MLVFRRSDHQVKHTNQALKFCTVLCHLRPVVAIHRFMTILEAGVQTHRRQTVPAASDGVQGPAHVKPSAAVNSAVNVSVIILHITPKHP